MICIIITKIFFLDIVTMVGLLVPDELESLGYSIRVQNFPRIGYKRDGKGLFINCKKGGIFTNQIITFLRFFRCLPAMVAGAASTTLPPASFACTALIFSPQYLSVSISSLSVSSKAPGARR